MCPEAQLLDAQHAPGPSSGPHSALPEGYGLRGAESLSEACRHPTTPSATRTC